MTDTLLAGAGSLRQGTKAIAAASAAQPRAPMTAQVCQRARRKAWDAAVATHETAAKKEHEAVIAAFGDRLHIHLDGEIYEVDYADPVSHYARTLGEENADCVRAPMPGTVVSCVARAGDAVVRGDALIVIESMKLETSIKAWRSGTVETVHVEAGCAFERDALLVTLAPVRKA